MTGQRKSILRFIRNRHDLLFRSICQPVFLVTWRVVWVSGVYLLLHLTFSKCCRAIPFVSMNFFLVMSISSNNKITLNQGRNINLNANKWSGFLESSSVGILSAFFFLRCLRFVKCFYRAYCLNPSSISVVFRNQLNIHFVLSFHPVKRISKLEFYWCRCHA